VEQTFVSFDRVAPPGAGSAAPRRPGEHAAFELWLEGRLHDIYDAVVTEPLPEELLRLITEAGPAGRPVAALRAFELA
jgi:hypothetical protein